MKILFIIEDLGSGGAQRQMVNLALDFKKRGMDVSCVTFFYKDFYLKTLTDAGISHTCLPIKNPLKRILKFRKFIRSGNFDTVIAFLGVPVFLAELAALPFHKWKLIAGERSANPKILTSRSDKFMRFFHLFADHVVANSHNNMQMIQKVNSLLNKRKCHVIYNALDLNKYKPDSDYIFRKNNYLKILVPASYRRLKNLHGLIEAVDLLSASEKEQLQIHWYGDRSKSNSADFILPQAEKRITELGLEKVFTLHPATMDIHLKIREADVIGLFSYFEGLPNAVCEGMASGKPIIATAVSDVPLLIEDNVNGKLCKPLDIESIRDALRFFLQQGPESLRNMGELNRAKAVDLFEHDKIVEQYLKLL